MAITRPIPVRLPDEVIARLDAAARRIGHKRTGIIRFCVETWLRHFEIKGKTFLPVDWEEIMASWDGRTTAQSRQDWRDIKLIIEEAASGADKRVCIGARRGAAAPSAKASPPLEVSYRKTRQPHGTPRPIPEKPRPGGEK